MFWARTGQVRRRRIFHRTKPMPYWNVLLPAVDRVILSPGDIITDDLGRTAVIAGSEMTNLGWRMSAQNGNDLMADHFGR